MQPEPLLIAIVGPTGSGKSDLGLTVAETFGGEIVNCDSVQVHRYLDIGTAKTPLSERRGIPHHMIDIADPDELVTAGDYAMKGRTVLHDIAQRGRLPVIVGGTGFYLRALIEGLFAGPRRDPLLRERLSTRARQRPRSLHRILARLDRAAALRIHPNDTNKLIRALEVCLLTRRPLSSLHGQGRDALQGFRITKIGLNPPRDELYARLETRTRRMFEAGLLEEVRQILALGFRADSKSLGSLGYRQAIQALKGEITLEQATELTLQETRRYAKRQWTWFRREPNVDWLQGFGSDTGVQFQAINRIPEIPLIAGETFSSSIRI